VWQIADYQARLIATFIAALAKDPKSARWFRTLKARANPDIGHGIKWKDTTWHRFEIQHYRYRKYMERLIRRFGAYAVKSPEPRTMQIEGAPARAAEPLKAAS
jgi:hypothetical protein